MIEFKDLKKLIIKSCKSSSEEDINQLYNFIFDTNKFEKLVSQADANNEKLKILKFDSNDTQLLSDLPNIDSNTVQEILEYVQEPAGLKDIFNGKSHILKFMIVLENNGESIDKESSKFFNQLVEVPIYRVLIIHKFNKKKEMFEYSIYFRSNKAMMEYISNVKANNGFTRIEDSKE